MKRREFVVMLGPATTEELLMVEAAAAMAGARSAHEPDLEGIDGWLADVQLRPIAVVMSLAVPRAARAAVELRARHPAAALPVIGIAQTAADLLYEEAFTSGLDGLATDALQLGRRLRHLADVVPTDVARSAERVVVADHDRSSRLLIGRVFRDAGYDVSFAGDRAEALAQAASPKVRVVVCSAALECAGEPLSQRGREGSSAAWIVNTPPKDMPNVRARLGVGENERVAVHDAFACPATLLFVANELVNRPAIEGRKSERLLYGTTVRFRHAGRSDDDFGYMFNISGGGLYVRSLAPPSRWDEIWLEFTPPRSDRLVHLEGTTVWARHYGPASAATVPCGFGVEITGGSATDMLRYERSYLTFLAERTALKRAESRAPSVRPSLCPPHVAPSP